MAAIIGSSLVLVLVVALVVVLAMRKPTDLIAANPPTTTTSSSTTTTTIATTTTTAPIPATLNLAAFGRPYTTGDTVEVPIGFTGDPNAVATTELHLNGLPSESKPGLQPNYSFPASLAGNVRVKVVIKLKNGDVRESNEILATVTVPTTTAPPPPPTVIYREPPRTCYGCRTITVRSGLTNVVIRAGATRSARVMGTVSSGSYLQGDCYLNGENVSINNTTSSRWNRLADGNYIWDGFIVESLREC